MLKEQTSVWSSYFTEISPLPRFPMSHISFNLPAPSLYTPSSLPLPTLLFPLSFLSSHLPCLLSFAKIRFALPSELGCWYKCAAIIDELSGHLPPTLHRYPADLPAARKKKNILISHTIQYEFAFNSTSDALRFD